MLTCKFNVGKMMAGDISDESLVEKIRASSEEAFNELFQRYWKILFVSALKRTRNEDDAKDQIQELFVKLWNRREQLPTTIHVRSYLFTALKYSLINYFKADLVKLKFANDHLRNNNLINEVETDSYMLRNELETSIEKATRKMPSKMKEVFMLSYQAGYSPQEIAEMMNINLQSVKNYLVESRKVIKDCMRSDESALSSQVLIICYMLMHS